MTKILVIGDGCTDIFQYGRCERLSPEAPVPIFTPTTLTTNGGMSINVMENVRALGGLCDIITNDFRPTKTRYVEEESNQILLRVDTNDKIKPITQSAFDRIKFHQYDTIIITDYDKGFLTSDNIEQIVNHHPFVFLDTKKKLDSWADKALVIKLNEKETQENYEWLSQYSKHGSIVTTKGKRGATLNFSKDFPIENEHPVRDLSGAGDTFLAALAVKFSQKESMYETIKFANKCAAWVVTQKGVVVVDSSKIL